MTIQDFYAGLTPFYDLVYPDWEASVARQGEQLDAVVRARWGEGVRAVLDVSCGIGTQALGLAAMGYHVTASDLCAEAVGRAQAEAKGRGLDVDFSVADMRCVHAHHGRQFDLVLSCDNSLPHLLTDADILAALQSMYLCTRWGGGCLVSLRDYASVPRGGQHVQNYGLRERDGVRYVLTQVWDWQGEIYDLAMYVIEDRGEPEGRVRVMRTRYYALPIPRLIELMLEAGLVDVQRLDGSFFQPVVVGTRR